MNKQSFDDYQWHVDPDSGCWIWDQYLNPTGYGRTRYNGKKMLAHRAFWLMAGGTLTPGLDLHHDCHTPACVNPYHLREVTKRENKRLSSRLTLEDARFIRVSSLSGPVLASRYGVTRHAIWRVRHNKILIED